MWPALMSAWEMMRSLIHKLGTQAALCALLFGLASCVTTQYCFEPDIAYFPTQRHINALPSAFPPLSDEEKLSEWGKEFFFGTQFVKELDLYRAITCFKRALFLIPCELAERRLQLEFNTLEAYFLGHKYAEALTVYESGGLPSAPLDFPALKELLLILYESYLYTDQCEKALRILAYLEMQDRETAQKLRKSEAIRTADFEALFKEFQSDAELNNFLSCYSSFAKSPSKARFLNAVLPGAGYAYVGQQKAAATSFIINALFIAAAYQFFDRGYTAAGLITTSLEAGWYFGGINGAGLAAREYNEQVFQVQGKEFMIREKLFPVLMFQYAF